MANANAYQVGGTHYKTSFEHWDLVLSTGMGYFEGQASKYVTRYPKKGGVADLKKALHFINKLMEAASAVASLRHPNRRHVQSECLRYFDANQIDGPECGVIILLGIWETVAELEQAQTELLKLIDTEESKQPRLPGTVPLTEENHYAERCTGYTGNKRYPREEDDENNDEGA